MRIRALDHFAIELKHEAEHSVRGGVLGPEIEREIAYRGFAHCDSYMSAMFSCACAFTNKSAGSKFVPLFLPLAAVDQVEPALAGKLRWPAMTWPPGTRICGRD